MKKYLILYIFFLLASAYPQGISYSGEEIFNPYGNSNCILQDRKGYIWCGTNEGISRFDGFNFLSFYNGDPIKSLGEDNEGNIWGGTINGELIKYTRSTGKINKYLVKSDPLFLYTPVDYSKLPAGYFYNKSLTVTSILINKDYLYAATWGSGVFVFNLRNEKQTEHLYYLKDENSLPGNYITSLAMAPGDSSILCGSFDAGLITINLSHKKYTTWLADKQITSLYSDDKSIWAGSLNGLYKLDNNYSDPKIVFNKPVSHLVYNENLVAAAFDNSINIIDKKTGIISSSIKDSLFQDNNSLLCLMVDKTGIIWGSTASGLGLMKWKKSNHLFSYYSLPGVSSFAHLNPDYLFIGTMKKGLYKFSLKQNLYIQIPKDLPDIKDLLYANNGDLFIAYSDKLLSYNEKQNTYKTILNKTNISTLIQTPDGSIWAGTTDDGIIKIPADKNSVYSYYRKSNIYPGSIPGNDIKKLFVSGDELWGYTHEGFLFKYIKEKDEFASWNVKETQTNILTIYPTGNNFYIGTYGDGVYKFNRHEQKFSPLDYTSLSGFRNIFGILVDKLNNLWLSTESGLLQLNEVRHQLFYYSKKDGIDENHFNPAVQYIINNNTLLFGGMNGFVLFEPKANVGVRNVPELALTSFKVQNDERILTSLPVELNSEENAISFQIACLDYNDPQKNQYKWMLEGYDKSFNYSFGSSNYASYNQLPPGKYTLRLQGANANGIWSKETIIPLVIALPFYSTWWFILLAIVVLIALPGYFLFMRIQQLVAIKEIKTKLSADLHDDIGSGLTEISLLAELLKAQGSSATEETKENQLQFISLRARELVTNMSDIVWLVNPKECTLSDLVIRLKNKCLPVTESLGIKLLTEINEESEECKLSMEIKQNIYLILKEALNNSIKYSQANTISIQVTVDRKRFNIMLKDNGKGFDPSSAQMGNGIRNMNKRASDIRASIQIKSHTSGDSCGTSITLSGKL